MAAHESSCGQFFSPNSSWYRERRQEEWSPKSPETDQEPSFESDEENHESKFVALNDASFVQRTLSPYASPLVHWSENAPLSQSASFVLQSRGSIATNEEGLVIKENASVKSSSLVVGKRPRGQGLKDIDLTRNLVAKHIRETKEANKSPKKTQGFSSLARHLSCPTFSFTSGSSLGPSDRRGISGKTGSSRDLNFKGVSESRPSAPKVISQVGNRSMRLFSCPEEQTIFNELWPLDIFNNGQSFPKKESNSTRRADSSTRTIEVIDLTTSEETSDQEIADLHSQSKLNTTSNEGVDKPKLPGIDYSPLRRKTSKLSFSDDEDSDSNACNNSKNGKEKLTEAAKAKEEFSYKKKPFVKGVLKMSLFFALGALLLSFYLHANPHGFCLESEFSKNISGIGDTLKAELYGQHVAQKIITVALKNHFRKNNVCKPLVFSFHGWTGTGKTFVSNIITEHIFKRKMQSPFVHKFIVPLHFPHESEVNTYNEQLKGWIRGNVSHCRKGALFIFDEMDKIHSGMMDTIKDAILDYRGKSTTAGYQNMVFIFLSNSGGQAINNHVLRHVFEGKIRENLTSSELENIFHGVIENTPDIWFADLLKEDVIDHLVPFLPLERMHVKQCIRRDLIKKGFAVEETMVKNIADQMDYFPKGHNFFSVSGCKKVSSRVDVIMG
ncbi:uncharacterized protein [Montipora foliosa]|uniref:uncharacterized protein n=1 Tax=Montipora foliosa TaxID=591990 RepID=UPI0035F105EC